MQKKARSKTHNLFKIISKPSHIKVIYRDLFRSVNEIYPDEQHLKEAIEWLCRAQDITKCGGVSGGYSFIRGWIPPYPETTGYIIPTFLQYSSLKKDVDLTKRAIDMGDWEIEIQFASGAVRGGVGITDYPIVFNTGQVMLGWISLYRVTKLNKFLDAAKKAADWLIGIQDDDGKWSQYTHEASPHSYHTRVAWPLLELYEFTNNEKLKVGAKNQLLWALSQAKKNGWFSLMGFTANETPLTHTIAYTLRGLLESSFFLEGRMRKEIIDVVKNASEKILLKYESKKDDSHSKPVYLSASFNDKWESEGHYSCLTGNVQMAIIWLKMYKISNDERFLNAALKIIDQVKATQSLNCKSLGIKGGIAGSYPIWGKYERFTLVNWATKFFADAIMLKKSILRELKRN